jgi:hypothetical protein
MRRTDIGYTVTTASERIIDILNELRERMPKNERSIVADLNFCIKKIGEGKIYEATLEFQDGMEK